jgi:hypothetical protein
MSLSWVRIQYDSGAPGKTVAIIDGLTGQRGSMECISSLIRWCIWGETRARIYPYAGFSRCLRRTITSSYGLACTGPLVYILKFFSFSSWLANDYHRVVASRFDSRVLSEMFCKRPSLVVLICGYTQCMRCVKWSKYHFTTSYMDLVELGNSCVLNTQFHQFHS